jgi:hypothetical protein
MDTFSHSRAPLLGGFFAVLILFAAAPARSETAPETTRGTRAAVFADERGFMSYILHGSTRDRVVQLCVLCMAAALFIMMKKFAPDGNARRPSGSANRPMQDSRPPTPNL